MVKKSSGAAEVEVRREVGEVAMEASEEVEVEVEEVRSERREVVGSRWLWRCNRFDNISMKD